MFSIIKYFRYLLEALVVFLLLLLFRCLPLDLASWLGGKLARLIGRIAGVKRIAKQNLALALPNLSDKEHAKIIQDMWENLGRTVAEFPHMYALTPKQFAKRITIDGQENLDLLQGSPHGSIIFSGHIGNWELTPRVVSDLGIPIGLVYREANNPFVNRMINAIRAKKGMMLFPKGKAGARHILKALKKPQIVGILVDQKMNDGIAVPFFGHDAMTAPAVARLALSHTCPLVPIYAERTKGAHFIAHVLPPLKLELTGNQPDDTYAIMKAINEQLETWIRQNPAQWFWVHKRWPKELYASSAGSENNDG